MAEPAVVDYFLSLLLPLVAPAVLTAVLFGPGVKAVPPTRKVLIAMPGFVFVTV
ncbi:hypothetical protein Mycsm_05578 [Mycobacterium sp. JS623]|nr:hypothetical protein Mycsm_05578 [Mycobacterium sp. JS623]